MKKSAPARTTRACKACRSLKVRCLPSDNGEICAKCTRSGAECVFEEQKPRRKREKPDSRTRVAALESKLEDLIAQLKQSNNNNNNSNDRDNGTGLGESINREKSGSLQSNSSARENSLPTPESQTRDGGIGTSSASYVDTPGSCAASPLSFARYAEVGVTPEELISRGLLAAADIMTYLDRFREMCYYFPFVVIPFDATVDGMLKERPLLLHAALAAAASSDVHLQKALDRSFKEIMLRKLMLEAEKTIDLLQSVLVCIGWGHFFQIPKRDQSYQLVQMAFGLCVDMGLNLTPSFAMQKRLGLHLDHYNPHDDHGDGRFWSKEARRAYLGCYHVSLKNTWIWAKPNTVEYSDYTFQCAQSISENPEYPTDELILPLIQSMRIGDEYHKVIRVDKNETHSQLVLDRLGTHVRSFQNQIQDLRQSLSPTVESSMAVRLSLQFTMVHTYEQDLLSPFTSISRLMSSGEGMIPSTCSIDSPSRIDILLNCLEAAVTYLDSFLTIPISSYHLLSTSQLSGAIYSIVIIYRLSIGTPRVPLWDVQVTRNHVRLENYLEILCSRLQQATKERLKAIASSKNRDLYSVMGLIMHNVKNTYERLRRLPQAQSSCDDEDVHALTFSDEAVAELEHLPQPCPGPIFEEEQPRPGYQSRCPAMQFWSLPEASMNNSINENFTTGDPFLNMDMNLMDDDTFWNQTFGMEHTQWREDLDIASV